MDRRQFLVSTLSAGAAACVTAQAASLRGATSRRVYGMVSSAGQPLSNVLVSDGFVVVKTDQAGHYDISTSEQSGRFAFVTTPRGYWMDDFYQQIDHTSEQQRIDFELTPVDQPDRFDFVFITDMHLEKKEIAIPKFQASLEEIGQLDPRPAFLWAQGDICLEGGMGDAYCEALETLHLPQRHGAGNHEMILNHTDPRAHFQERFGPTYYSFDWGPLHCIVLDGNKPLPDQQGWQAVHGAVEGRELAWLEADLAAQPTGKPVVVGVHIPIVSSYPERREHSPDNAPYWEMTNHRQLTELLARHRVRLVLQGHMHENERTTVGGVEYVETNALSGTWWKSGTGFERGVDGSPRGYRIVSVDGLQLTHRFRSSCESHVNRQGEFVDLTPDQPIARKSPVQLVFNCYDAPHGSTARGRVDGGQWQSMPACQPVNESFGLKMPHHFQLVCDTRKLSAGLHRVEAAVTWPDRTVVREQAEFSVAEV